MRPGRPFAPRRTRMVTHGKVYCICYREYSPAPDLWEETVLKDGEDQAEPPGSFASYIESEDGVRRRFKPLAEELRSATAAEKRTPPVSAPPAPPAVHRALRV